MKWLTDNGDSLIRFIQDAPISVLRESLTQAGFYEIMDANPTDPRSISYLTIEAVWGSDYDDDFLPILSRTKLPSPLAVPVGTHEEMPLAA
jgi:hypothetical protein